MDPSAILCLSYDSLQDLPPQVQNIDSWYSTPNNIQLKPHYLLTPLDNPPSYDYCDQERYQTLQRAKNTFETLPSNQFEEARIVTNPFEAIGKSIFINRAGVKLGNIDAVHHITNEIFTLEHPTTNKEFTFCDVAAGPGAFTQYLQHRFPKSRGYGITLKTKESGLNWSTKFLNMNQFTTFDGPDKTGNLYTNWHHFINFVNQNEPLGVDLITADGGIEVYENQEFFSSRLLACQAIIGISCTKVKGNFVLKVFDTVTEFSAQLVFLLAQCFERINIFKPVSSRPANSERYLICMNRRQNIHPYYQVLANALMLYTDKSYLISLFSNTLPEAFRLWLIQVNENSIDSQIQKVRDILSHISGHTPSLPKYNIHKFLLIWNLPEDPLKSKEFHKSIVRY